MSAFEEQVEVRRLTQSDVTDEMRRCAFDSNLEYSRLMLGGSSEALGSDIRVTFAPVSSGRLLSLVRTAEKNRG